MLPTNKNERIRAFWNFLTLFAVCIGIVITTIFFSVRVPFRENDQYRSQMKQIDKEQEFSKQFMSRMLDISAMLDSINTKASRPDLLDGQITADLRNLKMMTDIDSSSNKVLYNAMIQTLYDAQTNKKQLRDFTGKDNNTATLQMQLQQCQSTINFKDQEILNLRAALLRPR